MTNALLTEHEKTLLDLADKRIKELEAKLEAYRLALADIADIHNQFGSEGGPSTASLMANIGNIARITLRDSAVEKLNPNDSRIFAEALANPPEPNEALRVAAKAWQALKEHEQRRDPLGYQAYLDAHAALDGALGREPLPAFGIKSE